MKETWIGLFHIKPLEGNQLLNEYAIGAYVNVLALAKDGNEFVKTVFNAFKSLDFEVENYEDIDLFEERITLSDVDEEVINLANSITPKNSIVFDVFHSYFEQND